MHVLSRGGIGVHGGSERGSGTVTYDEATVLEKIRELVARSRRVGTNVTGYTGPEIGRLAEAAGQRNVYGGYNWDTKVTSRSARFSAVVGDESVATNPSGVVAFMEQDLTRVFGGEHDGKRHAGHANELPIDYVHRVMGSGEDADFTFNCNLLVTTKTRANHHIPYMWGKMLREIDPVEGADDLYLLLVPDIHTGDFGRFYCMAEDGVTVGVGSDYMGEVKKGFLRMAMFRAKQRGILGIHAGTKIVHAVDMATGRLKRYGIAIFGNSGTGKTTNVGHSHFLNMEGEQALVVQDDFAGLRLRDGRVLGTEQGMFLKTDLDEDDMLLRPMTESSDFMSQNLYVNSKGEIQYLNEDLCANGRGILPLSALPRDRCFESIDFPPLEELDEFWIVLNTRANTVVPVFQELTVEQCAAGFMLGESVETAAGDPSRAGRAIRVVGTNPFVVGDPTEEGNLFYEYLKAYESKIRCFMMNTGGVGEIADPESPLTPLRPTNRPGKAGIGYVTQAVLRNTVVWSGPGDFGTRAVTAGVYGENGRVFDMDSFDPCRLYEPGVREEMVRALQLERIEYLEQFEGLDPRIRAAVEVPGGGLAASS